ncbi:hypothetical protein [Bacteroides reticulotermitis]|uniref:Uncharacterized protein n=2 Tax=Bacteroides reticulotermitis TaxID=1133319 RepID=W4UQ99_9BACE|nr:hypothetical protein [Bacteroides reticulotermitis]MBB4043840.1 hypothetical protein [Bacteroides reticulotermitis]GAE83355.1 hypothetical protein JCM10512_1623 [Bacteroides reticulotermitis JCM 10512]
MDVEKNKEYILDYLNSGEKIEKLLEEVSRLSFNNGWNHCLDKAEQVLSKDEYQKLINGIK